MNDIRQARFTAPKRSVGSEPQTRKRPRNHGDVPVGDTHDKIIQRKLESATKRIAIDHIRLDLADPEIEQSQTRQR